MKDLAGTYVGTGVICLTEWGANVDETVQVTSDFEINVYKIHENNYHVDAVINKNLTLDSFETNSFLRKSDLSLTFSVGSKTEITDGELTIEVKQEGLGLLDFGKYEKCGHVVFNLSTQGKYELEDVKRNFNISTVTKLKRKKVE